MTYSIHICTVGFTAEPSLTFLKHGQMPIDKMYLLNSDDNEESNESERIIRKTLSNMGIETVTLLVDPLDFTQIYDTTLSILDKEASHRDAKYYINFTNGTRVMSAAVVSAAFLMNSELYYVLNEEERPNLTADLLIKHYEVFNFPDIGKIKGKLKDILVLFSGREYVYNQFLAEEMGKMKLPTLRNYTKQLEGFNLITGDKDGKETVWRLTDLGTSVLKRLYKPIDTTSSEKGWLTSGNTNKSPKAVRKNI